MKYHTKTVLAAVVGSAITAGSASAGLIAHYTFDTSSGTTTITTPDEVGSAFATLGGGVSINTSVATATGSGGVLEMTTADGSTNVTVDGAVTSNNFSWSDDARTITFWWRAKSPNVNTTQGAYLSFGDTSANGTRFDIKESTGATLRVEVQGAGHSSNPSIDDGDWHFVAVVVPNGATFADVAWYVDGSATDLNASSSSLAFTTGTGPIVFGDSIVPGSPTPDNRTPNGYLDDVQVYDEALTVEQTQFLFSNPGSVIPEPGSLALLGLGGLLVARRRRG